jgi:hypothetical protein
LLLAGEKLDYRERRRLKRNHQVSINVTEWFPSVNVIGHKFCGQFACPMIKRAS